MPGKVVSKTLAQNDAVSVTLFAFEKGGDRFRIILPKSTKYLLVRSTIYWYNIQKCVRIFIQRGV